jgi:phosphoserine phosphatase RsbU/P
VMFADISGHGVAAALLSMLFKTAATEAFRAATSPAAGMTELNERLVRDFPEGQFACVTYLELTPGSRTVRFVRGSQEPLLLLTQDGVVREFADGGTPPGMFTAAETGNIVYAEQTLTLAPGESIVLYTDGVAEVCSPEKQLLGIATLHRWLAADRALPPEALARELHRRVTRYTRTTQLPDDFTVFIARAL